MGARLSLDSLWRQHPLPDEPVVGSNTRGVVSFARGGPETRSFTLFVNLSDNTRLDALEGRGVVGYPPIGRNYTLNNFAEKSGIIN